jgi:predicted RNase H-like HicB family nuclease
MSRVEDQTISAKTKLVDSSGWVQYDSSDRIFRCCVYLHPENVGFSVRAADLPGVVSEGEDKQEALDNITEAYQGAIESYDEHGEDVPWCYPDLRQREDGEITCWVVVHA